MDCDCMIMIDLPLKMSRLSCISPSDIFYDVREDLVIHVKCVS